MSRAYWLACLVCLIHTQITVLKCGQSHWPPVRTVFTLVCIEMYQCIYSWTAKEDVFWSSKTSRLIYFTPLPVFRLNKNIITSSIIRLLFLDTITCELCASYCSPKYFVDMFVQVLLQGIPQSRINCFSWVTLVVHPRWNSTRSTLSISVTELCRKTKWPACSHMWSDGCARSRARNSNV